MTYIAYDVEDRYYASICLNESDLQLCISNIFAKRPFPTVIAYEVDDTGGPGFAHDRTDEMREKYGPKPERQEYEDAPDWRPGHTRHMAAVGSFGRR